MNSAVDPFFPRSAPPAGGIFDPDFNARPGSTEAPVEPTADDRQEMTEKELGWHTTQAAARERAKAEATGTPAVNIHALAAGAAAEEGGGLLDIAGITTHPVSLGVMWALELVEPFLRAMPDSRAGDISVLVWILTHPREALSAGLEGRFDAIVAGAARLSLGGISAEQGQAIDDWYVGEVTRLRAITGAGEGLGTATALKKSEAASSPSSSDAAPRSAGN